VNDAFSVDLLRKQLGALKQKKKEISTQPPQVRGTDRTKGRFSREMGAR